MRPNIGQMPNVLAPKPPGGLPQGEARCLSADRPSDGEPFLVISYFNEMYQNGAVRPPYARLEDWTRAMPAELRQMKQAEAEALFRRIGITFAVYGEGGDPDRLIPFDMFPRVFTGAEWAKLERGIKQRARALNAFLHDIYHRQEILKAGRVPEKLILNNSAFCPEMMGLDPARGAAGTVAATGAATGAGAAAGAARHRRARRDYRRHRYSCRHPHPDRLRLHLERRFAQQQRRQFE